MFGASVPIDRKMAVLLFFSKMFQKGIFFSQYFLIFKKQGTFFIHVCNIPTGNNVVQN